MPNSSLITIGKITGAYGVRGWVRLESYAEPADNLFSLSPLMLVQGAKTLPLNLTTYKVHQHSWVAKFAECADRDQALAWRGAFLQISREQLPALPEDQYYWMDLEGLEVRNLAHQSLGCIDHLFNTGANDIIAVKQGDKEHYIPYVRPQVVKEVNLPQKYMLVDWEV